MSSRGPRRAKLGLLTPRRVYVLNDGGEVDLDLGADEWSLSKLYCYALSTDRLI